MPAFVHLHTHSHYSLLDGLGKIPDLLDRASELGMDALALTDHGVLHGLVEFWKEARKRDIRPILGVEAYLVPNRRRYRESLGTEKKIRHLTLLAEDNAGYQNLLKLVTDAHLHGFYRKPCVDYDTLKAWSGGLIVLSGCLNGDLPQAIIRGDRDEAERLIAWHLETFGRDRFFLELQHHPTIPGQGVVNEALKDLARIHGIGLVATGDVHYLRPEDAEAQDILLCVQTGTKVTDQDRLSMLGEDFSLKTPAEMTDAFRGVPEALANTLRIADRCRVELTFGTPILPEFPLTGGETKESCLRRLCEEGLARRYGHAPSPAVRDRLAYELKVIEKTGFAGYFLIVQDFVNWAKCQGIFVGPGRGSAAGSLVSYVVGITDLDPLTHQLVFERFLNPERISMPDIDLDFADDRREEVLQYVRDRYGRDHVAQIITFGTMAARAAVRDAGRALGYPYTFCDKAAKLIPFGMSLDEAQRASRDLQRLAAEDPQVQHLLRTARKLEGVARHSSTHAAGVVITPTPLVEHVPLQRASADDFTTITQYDMRAVEDLGLLKIDFLGLKNLTILQHCLRLIRERTGEEHRLEELPLDDQATFRLLQDALTTGVFQLESAGMKRYLKELKPTEFEDIVAMVSLYRPGPMELIPQYIAGKHGLRKPSYLHSALEPILKKTYGIAVYQEQVLEIARAVAGFTLGEADILRKAVGKKIETLLIAQREKFVEGAVRNGIERNIAERIFAFIEPFAHYGFNRAHAACYALISYQTAYLKTHFPAAFLAALLTSDESDTDRIAIEVAECTALGIAVLPPEVNESDEHFTVVDAREAVPSAVSERASTPAPARASPEAIRFGLRAIKNVGTGVVRALLEARQAAGPFRTIADFFWRVRTREFNKKAAESLAKAGAFDGLAERNAVLTNLEALLKVNRASQRQAAAGQSKLFGLSEQTVPATPLRPSVPASAEQRLRWEKELLGLYVSGHPLAGVAHLLIGRTTPIKELTSDLTDYQVRIGGIVGRVQRVVTRSQETMAFAKVEDQTGSVEVLVFPRTLEATADLWEEEQLLLIEGKISDRDGVLKIICEDAQRLAIDSERHQVETLVPSFPGREPEEFRIFPDALPRPSVILAVSADRGKEILLTLKSLLHGLPPGPSHVYLRLLKEDGTADLVKTSYAIEGDPAVWQELRRLLGPQAVEILSQAEVSSPKHSAPAGR